LGSATASAIAMAWEMCWVTGWGWDLGWERGTGLAKATAREMGSGTARDLEAAVEAGEAGWAKAKGLETDLETEVGMALERERC
jgi:hypothetical protein